MAQGGEAVGEQRGSRLAQLPPMAPLMALTAPWASFGPWGGAEALLLAMRQAWRLLEAFKRWVGRNGQATARRARPEAPPAPRGRRLPRPCLPGL